jgi:hypothetical protein
MNYGTYGRDLLFELKRTETGGSGGGTNCTTTTIPPYNDTLVDNAIEELKLHVIALNEQVQAVTKSSSSTGEGTTTTTNGKPSMEVRPSLMLHEASIQRNKRCLLAYHHTRIQRIQQLHYWQSSSSALVSTASTEGQRNTTTNATTTNSTSTTIPNLNPAECDFLGKYNTLLSNYIQQTIPHSIGIDDLRTYAVMPPLTIDRIVVRVVDDASFIINNNNSDINLNDSDVNNSSSTAAVQVPVVEPIVLESGQTVTFTKGSTHYLLYSDVESYIRSGIVQIVHTEENEG